LRQWSRLLDEQRAADSAYYRAFHTDPAGLKSRASRLGSGKTTRKAFDSSLHRVERTLNDLQDVNRRLKDFADGHL
jgi:hypothetical protein